MLAPQSMTSLVSENWAKSHVSEGGSRPLEYALWMMKGKKKKDK